MFSKDAQTFEEALRLAQQGDALAQAYIALMYDLGVGVPEDKKEALKWYRKAAEQGQVRCPISPWVAIPRRPRGSSG